MIVANRFRWQASNCRTETVSFTLRRGQLLTVAGPVGSGKSRLLGAFVGRNPFASGLLNLNGLPLLGATPQTIARFRVAYVPQRGGVFRDMSARENLLLSWELSDRNHSSSWSQALVGVMNFLPDVERWLPRRAGLLSGGQQRLLAITMAWIRRPQVLVLDEPTTGLDAGRRTWVWAVVREVLRRGGVCIAATQGSNEVPFLSALRVRLTAGGPFEFTNGYEEHTMSSLAGNSRMDPVND